MYIDSQLQFSSAQVFAAGGGVGTNVIDLSLDRSIGNGEPMAVVFAVTTDAVVNTGDEDYTFDVEYAAAADQSTGVEQLIGRRVFETTPTSPAQDSTLLVVGFRIVIPIPPTALSESEQFLGIRVTTVGTGDSVACDAWLTPMSMIDATNDYASGFDIT
jgi:hypothetical protein